MTPRELVLAGLLAACALAWWWAHRKARATREALTVLADLLDDFARGDVTVRAAAPPDPAPEVVRAMAAVSRQGDLLSAERQRVAQATLDLRALLRAIDAVVFTLDRRGCVTWINRRGIERFDLRERVLGRPVADTPLRVFVPDLGAAAAGEVSLCEVPTATGVTVWQRFAGDLGGAGPGSMLIAATDISAAMRRGEARAFSQLVRVLSHELNNSLAPIASVTGSVAARLEQLAHADAADNASLLRAVSDRAMRLADFVGRFARLSHVAVPQRHPVAVESLIAELMQAMPAPEYELVRGPAAVIAIDRAQVEQALVNLVTNALQASAERGRRTVRITWAVETERSMHASTGVRIDIEDAGRGITAPGNLFVPFYSTRRDGHGIGLFLSRQLIEANGGTLTLRTHPSGEGAQARITFPRGLLVPAAGPLPSS